MSMDELSPTAVVNLTNKAVAVVTVRNVPFGGLACQTVYTPMTRTVVAEGDNGVWTRVFEGLDDNDGDDDDNTGLAGETCPIWWVTGENPCT